MKVIRIIKALLKPRPMVGIVTLALAIYLGSLQHIPLYWSIPAGLEFAGTFGFIYDFIAKEMVGSNTAST